MTSVRFRPLSVHQLIAFMVMTAFTSLVSSESLAATPVDELASNSGDRYFDEVDDGNDSAGVGGERTHTLPGNNEIEWMRALMCFPGDREDDSKKEDEKDGKSHALPCNESDFVSTLVCDEGDERLLPLWSRRTAQHPSGPTAWRNETDFICRSTAVADAVLTEEDMATFPIDSSTVIVQPHGGKALVRMPTIFFTEDTRQLFTTTLLDFDVELVMEATEFTWSFTDSDGLTTADPGRPYPDHTVSFEYLEPGTATPALSTTWTGRYRVEEGEWREISGTISTDSTIDPIELVERRTYLVSPDR